MRPFRERPILSLWWRRCKVDQRSMQPVQSRKSWFFRCELIKGWMFLWQNFKRIGGLLWLRNFFHGKRESCMRSALIMSKIVARKLSFVYCVISMICRVHDILENSERRKPLIAISKSLFVIVEQSAFKTFLIFISIFVVSVHRIENTVWLLQYYYSWNWLDYKNNETVTCVRRRSQCASKALC